MTGQFVRRARMDSADVSDDSSTSTVSNRSGGSLRVHNSPVRVLLAVLRVWVWVFVWCCVCGGVFLGVCLCFVSVGGVFIVGFLFFYFLFFLRFFSFVWGFISLCLLLRLVF